MATAMLQRGKVRRSPPVRMALGETDIEFPQDFAVHHHRDVALRSTNIHRQIQIPVFSRESTGRSFQLARPARVTCRLTDNRARLSTVVPRNCRRPTRETRRRGAVDLNVLVLPPNSPSSYYDLNAAGKAQTSLATPWSTTAMRAREPTAIGSTTRLASAPSVSSTWGRPSNPTLGSTLLKMIWL